MIGRGSRAAAVAAISSGLLLGGLSAAVRRPPAHERWRFTAPGKMRAPPAISEDGTVFLACGLDGKPQSLVALSPENAHSRWVLSFEGRRLGWPVLGPDGMLLVCEEGRSVIALDASTGVRRWQRVDPDLAPRALAVRNGGALIVVGDHMLAELDHRTGTTRWSLRIEKGGCQAVVDRNGMAYAVSAEPQPDDEASEHTWVQGVDAARGLARWKRCIPGLPTGTALSSTGRLHIGAVHVSRNLAAEEWTGHLVTLAASTGELVGHRATPGDAIVGWPLATQGGAVIATYHSGTVVAYSSDLEQRLWTRSLGRGVNGSASISEDGTIEAVEGDGHVHALDVTTGATRWSLDLMDHVVGDTAVGPGGDLYVPILDDRHRYHLVAVETGGGCLASGGWPKAACDAGNSCGGR